MQASGKGGLDPAWESFDVSNVAPDLLWSDPVLQPGLELNADRRGVGTIFGPDITQGFMAKNGLALIVRSHEGPDARHGRDMPPMDIGYTVDHDVEAGVYPVCR